MNTKYFKNLLGNIPQWTLSSFTLLLTRKIILGHFLYLEKDSHSKQKLILAKFDDQLACKSANHIKILNFITFGLQIV